MVLHLWSSKCAPCRGDARLVEATWKRWGPRGVLVVGASVKEPASSAKAVIEQYDLTYPAVADPSGGLAERYGATAVPHTFFISAGGDIVGEVAGSPSVRQLELGAAGGRIGKGLRQRTGQQPRAALDGFLEGGDLPRPGEPAEPIRLESPHPVARQAELGHDLLDRARLALVGEPVAQLQHHSLLLG